MLATLNEPKYFGKETEEVLARILILVDALRVSNDFLKTVFAGTLSSDSQANTNFMREASFRSSAASEDVSEDGFSPTLSHKKNFILLF